MDTLWLLLLNIACTLTCCGAAYVTVSCVRACRSTDVTRIRAEMAIETSELAASVEKIAHQVKKLHARQAARDRTEPEPAEIPAAMNGDDKDAIRKQLGAQAAMIVPRR